MSSVTNVCFQHTYKDVMMSDFKSASKLLFISFNLYHCKLEVFNNAMFEKLKGFVTVILLLYFIS